MKASFDFTEQGDGIGCRRDPTPGAVEQADGNFGFQVADEPADRRLRDPHQVAGGGHAAGLECRAKGFDLTKVQAHGDPLQS